MNIDEQFAQLNARLDTIDGRFGTLDRSISEIEARLTERMRDMQTEIVRGFGTWAESQTIRIAKIEADHRVLDTAATQRLANLEHRLLEIEKRLLMEPPKPH